MNGIPLLGKNHKDVVSILKDLPISVTMVCCHPILEIKMETDINNVVSKEEPVEANEEVL